jgi:ribosomal protein S18 acetylase RimI-like enzyme
MGRVNVEALTRVDDPFVRHQLDHPGVEAVWRHDEALVVQGGRSRPDATGPMFTAFGPANSLAPLMAEVADETAPAYRVTVVAHAGAHLPLKWRQRDPHRWHWMLTRSMPPDPGLPVEEVDAADEVEALLDVAQPDAHARPGTPGIESWLGVRDRGALVAVGALLRQADGTGHLRAVSVHPAHRGRGIGRGLSAALTRRALGGRSGVATLGVYIDNVPALATYTRLGYTTAHTFVSGPVS